MALVFLLPMRFIVPLSGNRDHIHTFCACPSRRQIRVVRRIGRIIRIAAKYTFFNSTCLIQAMTARMLLGRCHIPYVCYFDVSKSASKILNAHAWVCVSTVFVAGGNGFVRYALAATFYSNENIPPERTARRYFQ